MVLGVVEKQDIVDTLTEMRQCLKEESMSVSDIRDILLGVVDQLYCEEYESECEEEDCEDDDEFARMMTNETW